MRESHGHARMPGGERAGGQKCPYERFIVPEMLDHAPPEVARASLRDLARINRYLGGYYVLGRLFGGVVKAADSFSVLDIGAASGDMGAAIRRRYPRALVTSLDYKGEHLAQATDPKLVADAFACRSGRPVLILCSARYSCITSRTTKWWSCFAASVGWPAVRCWPSIWIAARLPITSFPIRAGYSAGTTLRSATDRFR